MFLCTMLWKTQLPRQLYFNQLAIECFQHHICDQANNNCSSLESDKSHRSLMASPLWSVLVYVCIIFYGKVSEGKIKAMDKKFHRVKYMKILETVTLL